MASRYWFRHVDHLNAGLVAFVHGLRLRPRPPVLVLLPPRHPPAGGVGGSLPPQASITWSVLPHNPYTKDGHAEPAEGRIVITLPFSAEVLKHELTITVAE